MTWQMPSFAFADDPEGAWEGLGGNADWLSKWVIRGELREWQWRMSLV
jgi:hypothetical protein